MKDMAKKDSGLGQKKSFLSRLLHLFPDNVRQTVQNVILSLAAGLSAVGFMVLVNFLFSRTYLTFAARSKLLFVGASFILIISASLLVGFLLNVFNPDAAGSGIPQVKSAFWKEIGYMRLRPGLIKFAAGALSIGGGNSLGREGPSVFIGSDVASNLSGVMGTPPRERRGPTVMGASAGLAAAFNAPLAAITFAIEEITTDLNSRFLGRVVLASVLGALVVHAIIGRQPAFLMPAVYDITWYHYLLVPVVALVASLCGVVFQRATLSWRGRLLRQKRVPGWLLPSFGGLITWVLGVSVFLGTGKIGVFGLGYHDLSSALGNHFEWKVAGVIFLAKLLATIASYAFGGCGGIFSPLLFIGGMSGFFLAGLGAQWIPLNPADWIVLSTVGMSTCLGTVVRAPLTSMLIVFEMTHQFELVPSLLLGIVISQAVMRLAGKLNFYDALLVQDGYELHKIRPPLDLQSWQSLPVSAIANHKPVVIRSLNLERLHEFVDRYPYNCFPVEIDGKLGGVVMRQEILQSILNQEKPPLHRAVTCFPDQPLSEVGNKFIESPVNVLVMVGRAREEIQGIITLHDIIRAQAAIKS